MNGKSLIEALKDSNSGARVFVYLAGVMLSIVTTAFFAGGIWWELRSSIEQQRVILEEVKALRRDMNILDGLMSRFRVQFDERADAAQKEHGEFKRRLERLENGRGGKVGG